MHGRLKVRTTAEQQEAKQKERAKKLAAYRLGIDRVFEKRRKGELDEEILNVTALLLVANPDIYTLWNVRKETLLHLSETNKENVAKLVQGELALTEQCIQVNPKSYNAWFQRSWVLDLTENIDWQKELALCDKCLSLDDRNFHCWDYRRIVVKKSSTSLEDEYKFSSSKIESNFSNYSSWHYRSELLPRIFPDPSNPNKLDQDKLLEECTLVQNAVFTDPNDQSAWFYHRWLLFAGQAGADPMPQITFSYFKSETLILGFSKQLSSSQINVRMFADDQELSCNWRTSSDQKFSSVWFMKLEKPMDEIKLQGHTGAESFECLLRDGSLHHFQNKKSPSDDYTKEILALELESCGQLQTLEPDNKWVLLRICEILRVLDAADNSEEIMIYIDKLKVIDPLRKGFYEDWRSQFVVEKSLLTQGGNSELILKNSNLTSIEENSRLALYERIDLSGNHLRHLNFAELLFLCKELCLDHNKLASLQKLWNLPNLQIISVKDNKIEEIEEIVDFLKNNANVHTLDFSSNPCYVENVEKICRDFPLVKIL